MKFRVVFLTLVLVGCQKSAEPEVPPPEQRPASVRPSIKWLPESPRYLYARRQVYKHGTDFAKRVDLGTRHATRLGRYDVSVVERSEPVKLNEFQSWIVHVESEGRPVEGAVLNVSGGMPQHGHGLPTAPRVTPATKPGDYLVEGLQFSMPGWWEVHVFVSSEKREDTVTFNVVLE